MRLRCARIRYGFLVKGALSQTCLLRGKPRGKTSMLSVATMQQNPAFAF